MSFRRALPAVLTLSICHVLSAQDSAPISVSGIYPHLASFNNNGECGIGAVVPWAGQLWWITYPPHMRNGSSDKLYSIDNSFALNIHPESVGGTHANRMIHRESSQLIIGPYFISKDGQVRAADVKQSLVGRLTATARHLSDPANKVYFYDMEGPLLEVDVHTLAVQKLFEKPVPGWHGKGAYTGQGRLIVANNGEESAAHNLGKFEFQAKLPPPSPDDAGVLAEWDGKEWRIVERKQFTDITGPGGIEGAPDDKAPVWAMGWDKRSVILKLLDEGKWSTFRLPKASHCFDPKHGWYTEWPRIREAAKDHWLMDMHGMFFDFPLSFSAANTVGIRPRASHLRYIPDFCRWNDRLVLAADDTSIMQNPLAGQSQSNLWFGTVDELKKWGPGAGWGGVWLGDKIKAGQVSDPFHFAGYGPRTLHLAQASSQPVTFTLEINKGQRDQWEPLEKITVPPEGYVARVFPAETPGEWVRVIADKDCTASAYFHYSPVKWQSGSENADLFAALADTGNARFQWSGGYVRPAKHNRNLQFVTREIAADGTAGPETYFEVDEKLAFKRVDNAALMAEASEILHPENNIQIDASSVILTDPKGRRYRLPKGAAAFDQDFASGPARMIREVVSERSLGNIHGTFYEIPRAEGAGKDNLDLRHLKPVASHSKRITDFCSWRGMLVLAGCREDAQRGQHYFGADSANKSGPGLWFGTIDDLWKLGKPVGEGGPWKETEVKANTPSDPYLMTGYDQKLLTLSHSAPHPVTFTLEVDYSNRDFWKKYQTFTVNPGQTVRFEFPAGYSAHWVRLVADKDCKATAQLTYR
ncbi:hypothetical protein ACXR0O_06215 [Verrucomicrobiota bacterium sgz303538]